MNKKQLIVMWVGIGLVSLILFYPDIRERFTDDMGYETYWTFPVTRTKLCLIVPVIAAGLIVTFKSKKSKDDQN